MGKIESGTTVFARAYLTELGRQYLFNSPQKLRFQTASDGTIIDLLKIERFSLGDPDIDYDLPVRLVSGDIPDLSGENENAVTGAKGRMLSNLISPEDADFATSDQSLSYQITQEEITIDLSQNLASLPVVITQQLMTFLDGSQTEDGQYIVTPTNYGNTQAVDGVLTLILRSPTSTEAGYRLRIFYPTAGENFNKMTFQFEKGTSSTEVVEPVDTTTTSTTTTSTSTTSTSTLTGGLSTAYILNYL